MNEEKLRIENPDSYRRLMVTRKISTALMILCIPLAILITWPFIKNTDLMSAIWIIGAVFMFLTFFVAFKISDFIIFKMFGEIARIEGDARAEDARVEIRKKYDTEEYKKFSLDWQSHFLRMAFIIGTISAPAAYCIFYLGLPKGPVAISAALICFILPYFTFNRNLSFFRIAVPFFLAFLVTSILISDLISLRFGINEDLLLFLGWAISLIAALYIAEKNRKSKQRENHE